MEIVVSTYGTFVNLDRFEAVLKERTTKFLNGLKAEYISKHGIPKKVILYKIFMHGNTSYLVLPRHIAGNMINMGFATHRYAIPVTADSNLKTEAEFYHNQKVVTKYLMEKVYTKDNMEKGKAVCTLDMGAGYGKTATAALLGHLINGPYLYVVPTIGLQKQTYDMIKGLFPDARILRYNKLKYKPGEKWDVVIAVVNSAITSDVKFYQQFRLVVLDEIHKYCGLKMSQIFWKANVACVLGMSGTTADRTDKMDSIYYKHYGKPIEAAKIEGFREGENTFITDYRVISYYSTSRYDLYNRDGSYNPIMTVAKSITTDAARNALIVDEVVTEYLSADRYTRYIYVFSVNRLHLETLRKMIVAKLAATDDVCDIITDKDDEERIKDKDKQETKAVNIKETNTHADINAVMGGASEAEVESLQKLRIILTTYAFGGTGISINHMNTAIFATPRRNGWKQICARILRLGSDLTIPRRYIVIIDQNSMLRWQYSGIKQFFDSFKSKCVGSIRAGAYGKAKLESRDDNDDSDDQRLTYEKTSDDECDDMNVAYTDNNTNTINTDSTNNTKKVYGGDYQNEDDDTEYYVSPSSEPIDRSQSIRTFNNRGVRQSSNVSDYSWTPPTTTSLTQTSSGAYRLDD
jgi:hypothetical protein